MEEYVTDVPRGHPVRRGDAIPIPGDYQYRALVSGHPIQRAWHANKLSLVDQVLPRPVDGRVLDLGCGSGVISNHLGKMRAHVLGVDVNPAAIAFALQKFGGSNVSFLCGTVSDVPEIDFDLVCCLEVIEHIHIQGVRDTLALLTKRVPKGGCLFLTTPNYRSAWPLIEKAMDRFRLAPQLEEAQHVTRFRASLLREVVTTAGWRIEEMGSFNGLGPFLALLAPEFARRLCSVELRCRRFLGFNLLYVLARRQ